MEACVVEISLSLVIQFARLFYPFYERVCSILLRRSLGIILMLHLYISHGEGGVLRSALLLLLLLPWFYSFMLPRMG